MKNLAFWIKATVLIGGIVALASTTGDGARMPDLDGAVGWLNSVPLSSRALRGNVVLVNFWTYSCINSLREMPYMKDWAAKYKDVGLVVIGVHAPEFGFEKETVNVKTAVFQLNVTYPIPVDSYHSIWNSFHNEYWPADYFIDAKGRIRYHHFGEGEYDKSERVIQALLRENGATGLDESLVRITAEGPEAPPSDDVRSPETYVGSARTGNFASPERMARDSRRIYSPPARAQLNQWGLGGRWKIGSEQATLELAPGKIVFRFHSRDLHMVLGPSKNRAPVRFKIKVNGAAPGNDHGSDSDADGTGEVRQPRMYQFVRQKGRSKTRPSRLNFSILASRPSRLLLAKHVLRYKLKSFEGNLPKLTFGKEITGLVVIDPYNDFISEEIAPWHEHDELRRGLRVTYLPDIASHSRQEDFSFASDLLLCRHDYHVEAPGRVCRAQYVFDPVRVQEITVPTKRREYMRDFCPFGTN